MSDVKSFRFNGLKKDWDEYAAALRKEGKTIEEDISRHIHIMAVASGGNRKTDEKTASKHQDELRDMILQNDLKYVLSSKKYYVDINAIEFVNASRHELADRIKNAVCGAIYRYWVKKWCQLEGYDYDFEKANTKKCESSSAKILDQYIHDTMDITFDVTCVPQITLSDLRESHLEQVVKFECLIIGPSAKKLDTTTGKYIQKVLIQEPESLAKNNNPVVMKCIVHGNDTNNMASGQTKKIIGIYKTQDPTNGQKVESEKPLIIDCISVKDSEETREVTLTPHEISVTKEFAENQPEKYRHHMIESFCPKIYGRELEKMALYLAILGGSDFAGYRKESHLMLVGEADTAKSELVKFANDIAEKSSIIDGSNSTGVGVLFALDEYDGIKILRAGAMILNSGGHLIIDEYDKMPKSEQKKLNQAMEQQRATYNKGGHVGNAETKTTIISACNPEYERWNETKDIIDNLPFDASTVSRYDIVLRLKHDNQENQIRAKIRHITKRKRGEIEKTADPTFLRGLLNYQRRIRPILTPDAEELLIDRFVEFTQIEQPEGSLPIQTRQMEGIQRLCEAWAKFHFKKEIDKGIVENVIGFYNECLHTLDMRTDNGVHQIDLRGSSINRDEYFEEIFRNLSLEDDDGDVVEYELAEKLMENPKFFKTDKAVSSYIDKRKGAGWCYEPRIGKLRRQR